MVFTILWYRDSVQRYSSFCIVQIRNWWRYNWLQHADTSQIDEEYLNKEWMKANETCYQ